MAADTPPSRLVGQPGPEEDSSSDEALPPLFEDGTAGQEFREAEYGTRRLHSECGWSVIERRRPDGVIARWLSQEGAISLDQTRVELRCHSDGEEPSFVRDRLNSVHHQADSLLLALLLSGDRGAPSPPRVCILGGGGMALPMALLAALPSLEAAVVERDATATRLARRYFGAGREDRLQVIEADALAYVSDGHVPKDTAALFVDIDFLRDAPAPPAALTSADFWRGIWGALRPRGLVALNAIGATPEVVDAVAVAAMDGAGAEIDGLAAGALEPSAALEKSWSAFVPRPSTLVIGREGHLRLLAGPPEALEEALDAAPWARQLASGVLRDLASGVGQAGRWRRIGRSGR
mmetsp:Transcript_23881/g.65054  ORF Transcript_23881/g.65054 Transcript_23881/m.65054 type:complete len:350 (-) Transcript_23881:47-1096(-)